MARLSKEPEMPFNERGRGIPASALSRYCKIEIKFHVCFDWKKASVITHKLQEPTLSRVDVFLRQPVCTFILGMHLRACFFLITFKDQ